MVKATTSCSARSRSPLKTAADLPVQLLPNRQARAARVSMPGIAPAAGPRSRIPCQTLGGGRRAARKLARYRPQPPGRAAPHRPAPCWRRMARAARGSWCGKPRAAGGLVHDTSHAPRLCSARSPAGWRAKREEGWPVIARDGSRPARHPPLVEPEGARSARMARRWRRGRVFWAAPRRRWCLCRARSRPRCGRRGG
jgi:hypothetical protein